MYGSSEKRRKKQRASVEKFTESAVVNQLRHIERTISKPANKDIDQERKSLNYSLVPDRGVSAYEYFKERKKDLYCYSRADVKVLAGWIVTAPRDLPAEQEDAFFQSVYTFLSDRYGEKNCVQAIVHNDESGRPHLHYYFIPVVADKKHGGEKICANDVLNKKELRNFHPALQRHLLGDGIRANIQSGITRMQGGNRTVKEMKRERDLERDRTRERGRW